MVDPEVKCLMWIWFGLYLNTPLVRVVVCCGTKCREYCRTECKINVVSRNMVMLRPVVGHLQMNRLLDSLRRLALLCWFEGSLVK